MLSDLDRQPDWQAALARAPSVTHLMLRDYGRADRAALATDMAAVCRRRGVVFSVAGNARLARHVGAAFHCPAHLLRRLRPGHEPSPADTAAVHDAAEIIAAAQAGFRTVLLSPVFATASHPGARPLGPQRAAQLAGVARQAGLGVLALGGMDAPQMQRLDPAARLFSGYAAISAFAG